MTYLVPPPEITVKKEELQRRIDDGVKELSRLQGDIQSWKEQLKAIDFTIVSVYGDQQPVAPPPMADPSPASTNPAHPAPIPARRRVPIDEYETIIVPFVQMKGIVRQKEIQARVSDAIGFPATIDMIKTAMDTLVAHPRSSIVKLDRGLYGYRSDIPPGYQQPTRSSVTAGVA